MPLPEDPLGKSLVRKRTIDLDGHRTSVSVEDAFWDVLKEIADAQGSTVHRLAAAIDSERCERQLPNLSSAIRLYVLNHNRRLAEEAAPGGGKAKR